MGLAVFAPLRASRRRPFRRSGRSSRSSTAGAQSFPSTRRSRFGRVQAGTSPTTSRTGTLSPRPDGALCLTRRSSRTADGPVTSAVSGPAARVEPEGHVRRVRPSPRRRRPLRPSRSGPPTPAQSRRPRRPGLANHPRADRRTARRARRRRRTRHRGSRRDARRAPLPARRPLRRLLRLALSLKTVDWKRTRSKRQGSGHVSRLLDSRTSSRLEPHQRPTSDTGPRG